MFVSDEYGGGLKGHSLHEVGLLQKFSIGPIPYFGRASCQSPPPAGPTTHTSLHASHLDV